MRSERFRKEEDLLLLLLYIKEKGGMAEWRLYWGYIENMYKIHKTNDQQIILKWRNGEMEAAL